MSAPLTEGVLGEIRARAEYAGEGANDWQTLRLLDYIAELKRIVEIERRTSRELAQKIREAIEVLS